jgi:hypothetical protein
MNSRRAVFPVSAHAQAESIELEPTDQELRQIEFEETFQVESQVTLLDQIVIESESPLIWDAIERGNTRPAEPEMVCGFCGLRVSECMRRLGGFGDDNE